MKKRISKEMVEAYYRNVSLLKGIQDFVKKHQMVTYVEFDYYVVHDMTLFSIEPDFDFDQLDQTLHEIKRSITAIKRIFSKPIIVLKDTDDVLPVENARVINQNTLLHLANHTQYVANLHDSRVKPRKLLTRIYEDDYSIYENVIFCNFIDDILLLIKKNRRTLNSLLYASNVMSFNLLEKVNHMKYFLAIGKLHTGYIRDFSQYFDLSKTLLHELAQISQAIQPRLIKPIYQRNKKRNRRLKLKKTNIFLMQKDYRMVYKTYKHILSNQKKMDDDIEEIDFENLNRDYLTFVQILTLFAVGHFNFDLDPKIKMNLISLDTPFTFKGWTLDIFNNNKKEIFLYFTKEKTYKMMIVANHYDTKEIKKYKKDFGIDEIVVVNQFDDDYLNRQDIYISMEDVDSFRRIQQIILKGMIYADTKRDVCPFCGGKLHKDKYHDFYQCQTCMTQIKQATCPTTRQSFYYTDNAHLKKYAISKQDFKHEEYWYYNKKIESSMYFRNITKINQNGDIVCPHCHEVHEA